MTSQAGSQSRRVSGRDDVLRWMLAAVACGAVLWLDSNVSLGVASGVLYVVPVLFTQRTSNLADTWIVAGAGAAFTLIGWSLSPDGNPTGQVGTNRSMAIALLLVTASLVHANKRASFALVEQALTDPLTGLYNRRAAYDMLARAISRAEREHGSAAVLYIDIDNFKLVNDRLGHDVGDAALKRVGATLDASTRRHETVGRIGGDEFLIVLETSDGEMAAAVEKRVAVKMCEALGDLKVPADVRPSIGIAVYPGDGTSAEELVSAADRSMYAIKVEHHRADRSGDSTG